MGWGYLKAHDVPGQHGYMEPAPLKSLVPLVHQPSLFLLALTAAHIVGRDVVKFLRCRNVLRTVLFTSKPCFIYLRRKLYKVTTVLEKRDKGDL